MKFCTAVRFLAPFAVTFAVSLPVFAYIPPLSVILSRTTDNHGKGFARITQNVIFTQANSSYIVKETWITDGAQKMVLLASGQNDLGQKFQFQSYYALGNRHFVDSNGARKVSKVGDDWFEDLFLHRTSDGMIARLHALKMIPAEALRRQPDVYNIKNITHPIESFLRLSRSGGKVAFAISVAPPATEEATDPTLWIEQDGFVVLKARFPSESTVSATDYKTYGENFHFASQKEVRWKTNRVLINTTKVEVFPRTHSIGKDLSVNTPSATSGALVMPAIDGLQEFYSRFR
jgi:hypothetical protein